MKLNKILEIMLNCILYLKVKGQSTPLTYLLKMKNLCIISLE